MINTCALDSASRLCCLAAMSLLAACGGGSQGTSSTVDSTSMPPDSTAEPAGSAMLGTIHVVERKAGKRLQVDAGFRRFSSRQRATDALMTLSQPATGCQVIREPVTLGTGDGRETPPESSGLGIDAGESIRIQTEDAGQLDVPVYRSGGLHVYGVETAFPEPRESSTVTLDLPGGEFPRFDPLEVPGVATLTLLEPTWPEPMNAQTRFRWTALEPSIASQVLLSATMAHLLTAETTTVTCTVSDTGSFAFPEAAQAELGTTFTTRHYRLVREFRQVLEAGDARLMVSRISEE